MDALVILIPLLPLAAAVVVAGGLLVGILPRGKFAAELVQAALALAALMALALLAGSWLGKNHGYFSIGPWLSSDSLAVRINFTTQGFNVLLAALMALLLPVVGQVTLNRCPQAQAQGLSAAIYGLFAAALLVAVLSANMVGTLAGWLVAEACAYVMASHYRQEDAAMVFISQRLGDIGLLFGISLAYVWTDSVNWAALQAAVSTLSVGQATGISLCFAFAAFAKSAQLPFTLWLVKLAHQPLPISPLLLPLGVFLVVSQPMLFMASPFARAVLGLVGVATLVYCYVANQVQASRPVRLQLVILANISLLFLECAFGCWLLASWHLSATAVLGCLLCLLSDVSAESESSLASPPWYWLMLQRFWPEPVAEWALIKPVMGLAEDLAYIDDHVIDRIIGLPSLEMASEVTSEAKWQHGAGHAGILGKWVTGLAALLHWFEETWVMRRLKTPGHRTWRKFGHAVNRFEQILLRPRYLVLFVCITFLVAF